MASNPALTLESQNLSFLKAQDLSALLSPKAVQQSRVQCFFPSHCLSNFQSSHPTPPPHSPASLDFSAPGPWGGRSGDQTEVTHSSSQPESSTESPSPTSWWREGGHRPNAAGPPRLGRSEAGEQSPQTCPYSWAPPMHSARILQGKRQLPVRRPQCYLGWGEGDQLSWVPRAMGTSRTVPDKHGGAGHHRSVRKLWGLALSSVCGFLSPQGPCF